MVTFSVINDTDPTLQPILLQLSPKQKLFQQNKCTQGLYFYLLFMLNTGISWQQSPHHQASTLKKSVCVRGGREGGISTFTYMEQLWGSITRTYIGFATERTDSNGAFIKSWQIVTESSIHVISSMKLWRMWAWEKWYKRACQQCLKKIITLLNTKYEYKLYFKNSTHYGNTFTCLYLY